MSVRVEQIGPRTIFASAAGERGWRRRERELFDHVESVCARIREVLDRPGTGDPGPPSWESVAALADECVERLTSSGDPAGSTSLRLYELVSSLYDLGLRLCHHDIARFERRLSDCANGLRRLRTLPSSTDLLGQSCQELVEKCGFGRAGLSRVESGFWRPSVGYQSVGAEFEAWFPDYVGQPIPIEESTPEIASVIDRRPVAVYDTTSIIRPPSITTEGGKTISYVVAPVMRGDDVVGFLHADHCPSRRRVDHLDGEVIGAFADGFGQLLEGVVLMERLREQRDQVWSIVSDAVRSMDSLCDAGIEISPWAGPAAIPQGEVGSAAHPLTDLTAREAEVFELMVAGATNGTIAEKLVITEDTVKSHVKHIFRKLGVANRSQAIARSLTGGFGDLRG